MAKPHHWTAEDISDGGERVSPLDKDFNFYGHLSIYDFATRYCRDAMILDVGCGSGYGSDYLAGHGALHVHAVDASAKAVDFCRSCFRRPNLSFQQMNAQSLIGFPEHSFDLIFTSNTLEHVPDIAGFLRAARTLLKPSGVLLVAVPPITNDGLLYLNIINPYHLNLWSPRQWHFAIGAYFKSVAPILHETGTLSPDAPPKDLGPGTEKRFTFTPGTIDDMMQTAALTSIFLATGPREPDEIPRPTDPMTFIDSSFSRDQGVISPEMRLRLRPFVPSAKAQLKSQLAKAFALLRARGPMHLLRKSTSALGRKFRGTSL